MAARVHHHHHYPVLVSAAASPARSQDMRLRRSPPPAKTDDRRLRRSPPVSVEKAQRQGRPSRGGAAVAGTAAGTAAGCAAACACFPFAVLELAVLATVRAPAAMCRRTIRERRNRRREARAMRKKEMEGVILGGDASPKSVAATQEKHAALKAEEEEEHGWCHWPVKPAATAVAAAEELAEAEKEVWERFYGTGGFGRSPSEHEETW
ncbi:hypothetical protein CFC21_075708 [Triticum aestivum]|uniref:Uncharacterized protein n=2 Tax=Triticum aestivum TaxID=4565 RepID=A0A9R1KXM2_WHEAT|nr:hypothetical protein CFC21_075708 [Triticum aestivum]